MQTFLLNFFSFLFFSSVFTFVRRLNIHRFNHPVMMYKKANLNNKAAYADKRYLSANSHNFFNQ